MSDQYTLSLEAQNEELKQRLAVAEEDNNSLRIFKMVYTTSWVNGNVYTADTQEPLAFIYKSFIAEVGKAYYDQHHIQEKPWVGLINCSIKMYDRFQTVEEAKEYVERMYKQLEDDSLQHLQKAFEK
jgi:hypothetical protein